MGDSRQLWTTPEKLSTVPAGTGQVPATKLLEAAGLGEGLPAPFSRPMSRDPIWASAVCVDARARRTRRAMGSMLVLIKCEGNIPRCGPRTGACLISVRDLRSLRIRIILIHAALDRVGPAPRDASRQADDVLCHISIAAANERDPLPAHRAPSTADPQSPSHVHPAAAVVTSHRSASAAAISRAQQTAAVLRSPLLERGCDGYANPSTFPISSPRSDSLRRAAATWRQRGGCVLSSRRRGVGGGVGRAPRTEPVRSA